MLAYNAIGIIDFSGDDYKILIEKYAFLEHLKYDDFKELKFISKDNKTKVQKNIFNDITKIILSENYQKAYGVNTDIPSKLSK